MDEMYKGVPFSPPVALADSIGPADTVIKVTDITAFPDGPNYATIGTDEEGETIFYAAKTFDSLSGCMRGIEGTAKSWPSGSTIARNFTNKDFETIQKNIQELTSLLDAIKDDIPKSADDLNALPIAGGTMEGPLHMNGQKLSGLNDPTEPDEAVRKAYVDDASSYGLAAIRAAAPANLLDNSDFTNPVAQAGIGGSHGNQAYAVDRWKLTSGNCNAASTMPGLYLNGTITQKLEHLPSGEVSAFVGMASGQANISYSDGIVTITSSGGVIAWAALYEGTYTKDTMPEYRPKGYGAELAECLRYCQVISQNTAYRAFVVSANTVQTTFPLGVPMRVKPSIEQFNFEIRTLASVTSEGFAFTANVGSENFIRIQASKTNHGLSDANTVVTSDVMLSADL